jgi:hypothetical protein
MAIVNSLGKATAGYGAGLLTQLLAQALADGANTVNVPVSPSLSSGKIRIKVYNGTGTTPAVTDIYVNGKDGTNSVRLGAMSLHPAAAFAITSTAYLEMIGEFLVDTGLAAATNGGSTGKLITQGITSFDVIITMSGTSEAALADIEVCGEP